MKANIQGILFEGTPQEMMVLLQSKKHSTTKTQTQTQPKRKNTSRFARRLWSQSDDETCIELTQKGRSALYIGRAINRTPIAVYERRSKLRQEGKL
jgi:hypothetical protein